MASNDVAITSGVVSKTSCAKHTRRIPMNPQAFCASVRPVLHRWQWLIRGGRHRPEVPADSSLFPALPCCRSHAGLPPPELLAGARSSGNMGSRRRSRRPQHSQQLVEDPRRCEVRTMRVTEIPALRRIRQCATPSGRRVQKAGVFRKWARPAPSPGSQGRPASKFRPWRDPSTVRVSVPVRSH